MPPQQFAVHQEQIASSVVKPQLLQLLQQVASGAVRPDSAALQLRELSSGSQQVRLSVSQLLHWATDAPAQYLQVTLTCMEALGLH